MPDRHMLYHPDPTPSGDPATRRDEEGIYDVIESSGPAKPANPKLATANRLNILLMRSRTCSECGYDLRGIPGDTCPKCGTNYDEAAEARRNQQEDWSWVATLKFTFFGTIPMFMWFPFAFALIKYGSLFGQGVAVAGGIMFLILPAIVAGRFTLNECDDIEGVFLAGFIMTIVVGVCGGLFWALFAMQ